MVCEIYLTSAFTYSSNISEKELHKGETVHEFTKDMQQAAVRSCLRYGLAVGNVMSYPGIWDIEDGRDGTSGNKSRISGSSLRMEYFPMMDITQWESILRNTLI